MNSHSSLILNSRESLMVPTVPTVHLPIRNILALLIVCMSLDLSAATAKKKPVTNDFPTQSRVEYVLSCIKEHGTVSAQEMLYKCSCAIDEIAKQVGHDEWVDLSTFANASTIAGERGAALRERKDTRSMVTRYRDIVAASGKACFIGTPK